MGQAILAVIEHSAVWFSFQQHVDSKQHACSVYRDKIKQCSRSGTVAWRNSHWCVHAPLTDWGTLQDQAAKRDLKKKNKLKKLFSMCGCFRAGAVLG